MGNFDLQASHAGADTLIHAAYVGYSFYDGNIDFQRADASLVSIHVKDYAVGIGNNDTFVEVSQWH
jgi:hypothetical protein